MTDVLMTYVNICILRPSIRVSECGEEEDGTSREDREGSYRLQGYAAAAVVTIPITVTITISHIITATTQLRHVCEHKKTYVVPTTENKGVAPCVITLIFFITNLSLYIFEPCMRHIGHRRYDHDKIFIAWKKNCCLSYIVHL